MKKILILFIFLSLILPLTGRTETIALNKPNNARITEGLETATLSWENPKDFSFYETVLFRSSFPIDDYYSYEAVAGICDVVYKGKVETYTDTGLAVNLPYYYILFARDQFGNNSDAVVLEKKLVATEQKSTTEKIDSGNTSSTKADTLVGATSDIVNQVSLSEAGMVYNYNGAQDLEQDGNTRRLALFIIVKSPHDLSEKDKNAISYFIHAGTPTTILLGTGERAGVLNSYLSVFDKLPRNALEWQDVIKIANGRWPDERNEESENQAANVFFNTVYERKPDMNNANDNAAVTVIAYGLRPANRNLSSEKKAIEIYRSIFGRSPAEAVDWDLVRAIAYSGATR